MEMDSDCLRVKHKHAELFCSSGEAIQNNIRLVDLNFYPLISLLQPCERVAPGSWTAEVLLSGAILTSYQRLQWEASSSELYELDSSLSVLLLALRCLPENLLSTVDLHVRVQRAFLLVALPTQLAAVRFLPSVRQHVALQVDLLDEAFGAELAAVGFLLLVEPLVCLQRDLLAKPLPTEAADEALLPRVDPHVGVQVPDLPEAFATLPAGVRFLPSVDPLVHIQMLAHGELLATDVAGVDPGLPPHVALDVSLEDGVFHEGLSTELADEGPLPGVELQVSLQRAFPGEVLPTLFAAEGLLAGVGPPVDLHVPESDAADVAEAAAVPVTLDVQPQTLGGFASIPAHPTAPLGLVAVSLCVAHKIPPVVESVSTHQAAVGRSQTRLPAVLGLLAPPAPPQLCAPPEAFLLAAGCCVSIVDLQVALQGARVAELLVAGVALERFLCRVDPHVCHHVALLVEDFAADAAAEGLFSRVKPQVGLLGPDGGEFLAADVAGPAALPMRLQVELQGLRGVQAPTTQTTATLRLLQVFLHVFQQKAFSFKSFPTHLAGERRGFFIFVLPFFSGRVMRGGRAEV